MNKLAVVLFILLFATKILADTSIKEIDIPVGNSPTSINVEWFDHSRCMDNDTKFYFTISGKTFSADKHSIPNAIFSDSVRLSKNNELNQFIVRIASNTGCKDNPANFLIVELKPNNDKLPKYMSITSSNSLTKSQSNIGVYIQHMLANNQCQKASKKDAALCFGTKTEGKGTIDENKIKMTFIIPMDKRNFYYATESTNYPLHATCQEKGSSPICIVSEYIEDNLWIETTIKFDDLSNDDILTTSRQLRQYINQLSDK